MWNHIPTEALIAKNAGIGAGQRCAVQSWLRTLDMIRALPQTMG
jgi:hypothetical protein